MTVVGKEIKLASKVESCLELRKGTKDVVVTCRSFFIVGCS